MSSPNKELEAQIDRAVYRAWRGKTVTLEQGHILDWAEARLKPELLALISAHDQAVRERLWAAIGENIRTVDGDDKDERYLYERLNKQRAKLRAALNEVLPAKEGK